MSSLDNLISVLRNFQNYSTIPENARKFISMKQLNEICKRFEDMARDFAKDNTYNDITEAELFDILDCT